MTNNVDPGFPGKPTVYPYYDPNDSTKYANFDPNSPGPMNQNPTSSTYVWGYVTGTVDTSAIPNGAALAPGMQTENLMALRYANGATITPATPNENVPLNPQQFDAPSVGGYYSSDSTIAGATDKNPT